MRKHIINDIAINSRYQVDLDTEYDGSPVRIAPMSETDDKHVVYAETNGDPLYLCTLNDNGKVLTYNIDLTDGQEIAESLALIACSALLLDETVIVILTPWV